MAIDNKILSLSDLARKSAELKEQGRTVVLCHGTFDLLHPGHIRHLRRASQEGDCLLVTITADPFVNKGPGRPVFHHDLRAENLASLECVSYVAINHDVTAVPVIDQVRPHVYVKGQDYQAAQNDITGNIVIEQKAVEAHGGRIFYTNEIVFSSTSLLNEHFDLFPPSTKEFLQKFRSRHQAGVVIDKILSLGKLKVLVVGEAIVDEYCYSTPMGITGKSQEVLSVRFDAMEQFAGGSLAIANHLAGYAAQVTLLTGLGRNDHHEPFIRSRLEERVQPAFFYYEQSQTLVKRRFVDADARKLFEVYFYDPNPLTPTVEEKILAWIQNHARDYDVVIVPDYGNGFISLAMVEALCSEARFLAVNTQINSGSRGYHAITRYPRADFVSLNEPEVRQAAHNRHHPLEQVTLQIAQRVKANQIAITMGAVGALMLDMETSTTHRVPALSTRVVDNIGAGDAFLSLAGLAIGGGLNPELALFLGSAAAALDVQIVCNREPVRPVHLFKYINTLLK
ncbi:MAG: adenylyltransferase/cytidyltransferase family protein [Magnetococcales bacterium]|nr:adenylyltransferase/cytidyltransferase family protein [Magnetococcales bacterium]